MSTNAKKIKYNGVEVVVDYAIKDGKGNQIDTTYAKDTDVVKIADKGVVNGVASLDSAGKVPVAQLPDYIVGQMLLGGTVANTGTAEAPVITATLSGNLQKKLGISDATITLINSDTDNTEVTPKQYGYKTLEAVYFIASAGFTFNDVVYEVGDWLTAIGTAWQKIDNTDAVTGVKGNAESTYRTGNINITAANIGVTEGATKVEASATNGNIKINGTETTVYNDSALAGRVTTAEGNITDLQNNKQDKVTGELDVSIGDGLVLDADGTLRATGVTSYNDLTDKPTINGNELSGNKTSTQLGLQSEITASNMLSSDLVDDTDKTHKFVSYTEKATWDAKQDALTETQMNAVNSGITSAKVSTYDGYATTIAGKQTQLKTEQLNAVNSGITASKVADLDANTAARHTHSNKDVLDGITAAKVAAWDSKQVSLSAGVGIDATQLSANTIALAGIDTTKAGYYLVQTSAGGVDWIQGITAEDVTIG